MKKIIFSLLLSFFFVSSLNASYLLANKNKCIVDYYYSGGYIYYHYDTTPNTQRKTSSKKYQLYIYPGFIYDSDNDICKPDPKLLGLTPSQFELVNASIAFLVLIMLIGSLL